MRRRDVIKAIAGSAATTLPITGYAQQSVRRPLIGILSPQPAAAAAPNFEALRRGLREYGYEEGRNIWLELRYAEGITARAADTAGRHADERQLK